jgi:competence CoiA-like predicted nuclease
MKFALVDSQRKEAEPKEIGICFCCGSEVRAYCGQQRVNHWKHINLIECDHWHEGETEWHRQWKNHFDNSQQEFIRYDSITGEKHIADIYIQSKDLVIEFQHSPIHIDEIVAREKFYKKMLWVIDLKGNLKKISLHNDIKDVFNELVEYPWAVNEDAKYRKLKKEGKLEEAEKLRKDSSGWEYLEAFEKK